MMSRLLSCLALLCVLSGIAAPASAQTYVCMETTKGNFCMKMLPQDAPNTVTNFLKYVNDGDYIDSLVHRSVKNFVIQGGGFYLKESVIGDSVPTDAPVINEFKRSNLRGTVAMARRGGVVNSATSQWFINLFDNTNLDSVDGGFTVFAEIVTGMNVVDKIAGYRIADLSVLFNNSNFTSMPLDIPESATTVDIPDFVVVKRAYQTTVLPVLPYQCSSSSIGDTLTEFCGGAVTFPVLVGGILYEATMNLILDRPGLVFAVDRSTLKVLADTGQERATFSNNVLTIPSVRNGANAFVNVTLALTSANPLEFTLGNFTKR